MMAEYIPVWLQIPPRAVRYVKEPSVVPPVRTVPAVGVHG
jgi:hypothetical protein